MGNLHILNHLACPSISSLKLSVQGSHLIDPSKQSYITVSVKLQSMSLYDNNNRNNLVLNRRNHMPPWEVKHWFSKVQQESISVHFQEREVKYCHSKNRKEIAASPGGRGAFFWISTTATFVFWSCRPLLQKKKRYKVPVMGTADFSLKVNTLHMFNHNLLSLLLLSLLLLSLWLVKSN